jgi:hypothetical protein
MADGAAADAATLKLDTAAIPTVDGPPLATDTAAIAVDSGPVVVVDSGSLLPDVPALDGPIAPGPDAPVLALDAATDSQVVSTDAAKDATTDASGSTPDTASSGACPCANGLSCCNNTCVALGSNTNNCGICGNGCKTDETCTAGVCTAGCTPDCTGKVCGSDGCGGLCGSCTAANPLCIQGSCQTCVPKCTGAACGDADGCGGRCAGTCATGTCSATGYCTSCTPSCTGKACGDADGCGGKCATGSCKGGGTCGADGTCGATCVPNCAGKTCGSNGCGGKCGNCVWPEICADTSVVASTLTDVAWTCIDQSLGCAAGMRAGYLDTAKYPDIAGCAWNNTSAANSGNLRKTRTGKWCGNPYGGLNLGTCDAPEDACSPGWHICGSNGAPKDLTDRITLTDCLSASEANNQSFDAALSPIDTTQDSCCPAAKPATFACPNDTLYSTSVCSAGSDTAAPPVACGTGADQSSSCSDFTGWAGVVPVDTNAPNCGSLGGEPSNWGGILCCKDPVHTGN